MISWVSLTILAAIMIEVGKILLILALFYHERAVLGGFESNESSVKK